MAQVSITFAGGAKSPTGSNFLITVGDKKFLVDCGLYQGSQTADDNNNADFIYDPSQIDGLFITHGHLDHVGRVPKLVKDGFSGPIFSTPPTRDIGELIMLDCLSIITNDAERRGTDPLFMEKDVLEAIHLWRTQDYGEVLSIQTSIGILTVTFLDAGHILGSSIIEFGLNGKKLVFTGDLGNSPSPLLPDTQPIHNVDYLVMESVYGDRNHEDLETRVTILKRIIKKTISRGGTLMIPAFSIERTQEMLFYLNEMIEHNEIPRIPVYLDSPLAINITKVYKKYERYLNRGVSAIIKSGDDIFSFPGLTMTITSEESKKINSDMRPKIIIAGSGMSNGGRIIHHEKNYLGDPRSTLLLVGYQAVGTMGRLLQDGQKTLAIDRVKVEVKAEIDMIGGFSAHKDSEHLVEFVGTTAETLRKVFVVLGEPKSSMFLAQRINEYYGVPVEIPDMSDTINIEM